MPVVASTFENVSGIGTVEIERYPHVKIAALRRPPAPHKRHRRTDVEIASAKVMK
jgi:hypothetical protein